MMDKYIKYKRFADFHDEITLQKFFDNLITEGWNIIFYHEHRMADDKDKIYVTVVGGKRQNNIL